MSMFISSNTENINKIYDFIENMNNTYFCVKIHDNIKSYFIHYHQRNDCCGTIKHNIDVYSNNIIEYANTKVSKRTDRMLSLNEEPMFIFETRPRPRFNANYNEDDVYDFINLNNQSKQSKAKNISLFLIS